MRFKHIQCIPLHLWVKSAELAGKEAKGDAGSSAKRTNRLQQVPNMTWMCWLFFFRGRRLPDTHFRCKAWRFFRHKTGHWTCKKSPNQPTMLGRLFTGHRFRDHFTSSLADGFFDVRKRLQPRFGRCLELWMETVFFRKKSGEASPSPFERFESSKSNSRLRVHWFFWVRSSTVVGQLIFMNKIPCLACDIIYHISYIYISLNMYTIGTHNLHF